MKNGFLGSFVALFAGVSLVLAQSASAPEQPSGAGQSAEPPQPTESSAASPSTSFVDRLVSPFTNDFLIEELGGSTQRFKARAEGLLWFPKTTRASAHVVTVGSFGGDEAVNRSFGGGGLDYKLYGGGRFWLDYEFAPSYGLDWNLFSLGKRALDFRDDTSPILARPFFNLNTRTESSLIVAFPGLAAGSVTANSSSQMWGTEAYAWKNLVSHTVLSPVRVDALVGIRYLELGEDLDIGSVSTFNRDLSGFPQFASFAGNRILTFDNFHTRSQFFGGEIGAISKFWFESIVLDVHTKLAIGTTHEQLDIQGVQSRTDTLFGRTTVSPAGLLALPSNIGRHTKEQFTVAPELTVNVNVPLARNITVYGGYNLIFWSRVLRAGEQIDRTIDVSQIPNFPAPAPGTGQLRPMASFVQSSIWVQGLNVGVQIAW